MDAECGSMGPRHMAMASFLFALLVGSFYSSPGLADTQVTGTSVAGAPEQVEAGRRMYRDGILPSGEVMSGIVQGDIALSGKQVICGHCHRRSGIGAPEGQNVARPVTGDVLYMPLRLPTSKPPLAPELRPAYTDTTLRRAIREGIGADGTPLGPLMPRYPLSDEQVDTLIAYLKTLSTKPDPGVTDRDIHFATIVDESVDAGTRKAFLDVFETYFAQKNTETRHETQRAEHAPWHESWTMETYRKWVPHVWELKGPQASWPDQLQTLYDQQPVFAVVSGVVEGSWQPIHAFCERSSLPCLFPVTDLPVVDELDFYSMYFSRGMALEADAIAEHLAHSGLLTGPLIQVYRRGDPRAEVAAATLRTRIEKAGGQMRDLVFDGPDTASEGFWRSSLAAAAGGTAVLWVEPEALGDALAAPGDAGPQRIYLSTTLYGVEPKKIAAGSFGRVFLVHPQEMPDARTVRLARSTGWFKAKRIYDPKALQVQANVFFALKIAGDAVKTIRGYYLRDYMIERIEHMMDNALYTSVYPSVTLSPGQRFVSKGAYIAQFSAQDGGKLIAVTPWRFPDSNQ